MKDAFACTLPCRTFVMPLSSHAVCPLAFGGACSNLPSTLNLFQTVHLIGTVAGAASSAFATRPLHAGPRVGARRVASKKINVYAVLQGRSPGIYAV